MTKLHLGVVEQPYSEIPGLEHVAVTTGDVAEWLESKYHVYEIFFEEHVKDIANAMTESMAGSLETFMQTGVAPLDPLLQAESVIETIFKAFLTNKEMEALGYPGVPTRAALEGISKRFKNHRGPRRPSFIDTGLYQASFKAWFDGFKYRGS